MLIAKKPALAAAAAVMLNLTGCGGGGGSGGTEAAASSTLVPPGEVPMGSSASNTATTPSSSTTSAAPGSQLGAITSTQLEAYTSIGGITTVQMVAMSTAQVEVITSMQLAAITTAQIAALSSTQIRALTSTQLGAFTSAQIVALGTTQLTALTSAQLQGLDPSLWPLPPFTLTELSLIGTMVDGYVRGATVYCDKNGNGVGDAGETVATTDANGSYSLRGCTFPVVGSGGTDTATGFAFPGVLRAPASSAFMTPLTTLLTGTGLGTAQLVQLLGLPAGTDPTRVDPTKNLALLKATLAVQQVMAQLAATIQAAEGGNLDTVYARVASALAGTLKTAPFGTTLVSASSLNADLLLAAAKAAAGATAFGSADLAALVADIRGQAEKYLGATSLDAAWSLARVLQDPSLKLDPHAGTRYFALHGDAVLFGSQPCTLTDLGSMAGVTLTGFDRIGLPLDVIGEPPVGTSGIALTLVKQGGSGRALQLLLDKVKLTLVNGQLTATVPSDTKVYLHGKKANGAGVTASASLGTTQQLVRVVDNTLMLDYGALVKRVLETAPSSGATSLQSFLGTSGTFQVTLVISKFNLRQTNAGSLTRSVVTLDGPEGRLSGVGFTGKVTVLSH